MGNALHHWSNINVSYLDALVICDLKLFRYDLWWAFDSQRLLGTALFGDRAGASNRLAFLLGDVFIFPEEVKLISVQLLGRAILVHFVGISGIGLLQSLIDLDWWHQSPLGQQRIDLLHELKRGVLLVQNQGVEVVDDDGDLPSLEEQQKLLPVILLLRIVLGIVETVHLDF